MKSSKWAIENAYSSFYISRKFFYQPTTYANSDFNLHFVFKENRSKKKWHAQLFKIADEYIDKSRYKHSEYIFACDLGFRILRKELFSLQCM